MRVSYRQEHVKKSKSRFCGLLKIFTVSEIVAPIAPCCVFSSDEEQRCRASQFFHTFQTASDDLVRQFRYYLTVVDVPEIAIRFRDAVPRTIKSLRRNPLVGPRYFSGNAQLQNLRSWPVVGFEAIRIYFLVDEDAIHVVRILHGKRDIKRILRDEGAV